MSTAEPDEKLAKAEVNYGDGHANSNCGICKWFLPKSTAPGACRWVRGTIRRKDWCELFHRDRG